MNMIRFTLAFAILLLAVPALEARQEKTVICHVGSEEGPNGETYDPNCIPTDDFDCPDAGKIDLIEVANPRKHLGTEARPTRHTWDGISDYEPYELGASGIGSEDDDDSDYIDEGCEPAVKPATMFAPQCIDSTYNTITVTFSAPVSNGATITGYEVRVSEFSDMTVAVVHPDSGLSLARTFTSLNSATTYFFDVRAVVDPLSGVDSDRSGTGSCSTSIDC